jgi:Epoxide hydrolase N terminus
MRGFTHQGGDNTFVQWKLVPPSGQIACEQRLHRIGSPTAFQRGMSMNSRTSVTTDQGSPPFRIDNAPESELAELLGRVMATRLLVRRTGTDQWQGVPLTKIQQRARYSGTEYDLREVAVKLNALPQFVTEIDGFDIRFVHLRSRHSRAMPLVMPRGRPELVLELLKFIGPLTDPTLHGGAGGGRFRCRHSLDAGLRLVDPADGNVLRLRPHGTHLARTDEATGLRALRVSRQ